MRANAAMQIQSVYVLDPKPCFGKIEARRRLSRARTSPPSVPTVLLGAHPTH